MVTRSSCRGDGSCRGGRCSKCRRRDVREGRASGFAEKLPKLPPAGTGRADVVANLREHYRPWAKAIKAAVLTRKMPPWFADARYGHFTNGRVLNQTAIDTIVQWVDNGASRRAIPKRAAAD